MADRFGRDVGRGGIGGAPRARRGGRNPRGNPGRHFLSKLAHPASTIRDVPIPLRSGPVLAAWPLNLFVRPVTSPRRPCSSRAAWCRPLWAWSAWPGMLDGGGDAFVGVAWPIRLTEIIRCLGLAHTSRRRSPASTTGAHGAGRGGAREWTRRWWTTAHERYELVTSPAVLDELSGGDPSRVAERLALVEHLPAPGHRPVQSPRSSRPTSVTR